MWWIPLSQDSIDGYQVSRSLGRLKSPFGGPQSSLPNPPPQVKFWRNHGESEAGAQTVTASNTDINTRLEGMKPNSNYLIEVRGYNTAGYGPPSERLQIRTKKARTSFFVTARTRKLFEAKVTNCSVSLPSSQSSPQDNR